MSLLANTENMKLHAAERIIYTIGIAALLVDLLLIAIKGARVDWAAYLGLVCFSAALFAGGMFYRLKNRSERIASALICTGGLVFFSMAISVFNYLLQPHFNTTIDPLMASWDRSLGFYWPDAMVWASQNPVPNFIMKLSYSSTMNQMAVLVIALGLLGKAKALHTFILTIVISATLAICFWGIFPSHGAIAVYGLDENLSQKIGPVLDQAYANELGRMLVEGPGLISPSEIRGLIGFPSYHAALAFIALAGAYHLKYIFPVFLAINIAILPGTIIHGGHHLMDIIAGFAVFAFSYLIATRMIGTEYRNRNMPETVNA